jgi:hypothetical protein
MGLRPAKLDENPSRDRERTVKYFTNRRLDVHRFHAKALQFLHQVGQRD